MRDDQSMQRRFKRFRDGKEDSLIELFDAERPRLYDYVVRMTGNAEEARLSIDHLWEDLQNNEPDVFSLSEWRQYILSLARRLNSQVWNANTNQLENSVICDELKRGKGDSETLQLMADVNKALQSLPGPEREVILLRIQHGLVPEDIKVVMDTTEEQVQRWEESGMRMLRLVFGEGVDLAHEISCLPRHTGLSLGGESTQALSEMIESVKRTKPGISVRWPIPALVLLGAGAAFLIVYTCR